MDRIEYSARNDADIYIAASRQPILKVRIMITVFKTFPAQGSGNVGDKLIGEMAKEIFTRESDQEVILYLDQKGILDNWEEVKHSDAFVIAAFALKNIHRYPLIVDRLRSEENPPPIVPFSTAWKDFPGDYEQITTASYPGFDDELMNIFQSIFSNAPYVSARDYYSQKVLNKMNVDSWMVGDCAWYDFDSFGEQMHSPTEISRLVVTDPHQGQYIPQLMDLLDMISVQFANAEKYFCFHSDIHSGEQRQLVKQKMNETSFEIEIREMSHETDNLEFYDSCDLHIGYRLHGHISFLRKRIPSVLLIEDGRGLGATRTFGTGGFKAFRRNVPVGVSKPTAAIRTFPEGLKNQFRRRVTGSKTVPHPLFPPNNTVIDEIRDFLQQELSSNWRRYQNIPYIIDQTYAESMKPFVKKVASMG